MKRKIFSMILGMLCMMITFTGVYAASAGISANKTSVEVGTSVTITVNVNAVSWNVRVTGAVSDTIVGANMDEKNQTTTKTYTLDTSKAGTYTVSISGDIIDETSTDYVAQSVNDSVTVTVKEKELPKDNDANHEQNNTTTKPNTNTNNNTNTNTNNNINNNNTTTTKKSSNANISRLTLNVEGLSFNSNQTTYNIKVGEDVENISASVTLSSSKAFYTISGNKNLKAGNNVIKIVVTAEDGTTKTYKINVEKAGNIEETSSSLTNLIIEGMTLNVPFDSKVTEYIGSEIKYKEKLNILAYTQAEQATYEIIGNENLKEGENTIVVKVTSKDKSTETEYKVTFNMLAKEETNALQVVNPYAEQVPQIIETHENEMWKIIKDNATIILLYILAVIEFAQVIYLYVQLQKVNPEEPILKRRNKQK